MYGYLRARVVDQQIIRRVLYLIGKTRLYSIARGDILLIILICFVISLNFTKIAKVKRRNVARGVVGFTTVNPNLRALER